MLRSVARFPFNPSSHRLLASHPNIFRCLTDAHSPQPPFPPHQNPIPFQQRQQNQQQQEAGEAAAASAEKEKEDESYYRQTHSNFRRGEGVKSEYQSEQVRVLRAALPHVINLGWSEAALISGARDVGISPAIVGSFPRKEAALVEYFMDDCLQRLIDRIDSEVDLKNLILSERLAKLIRIRLEMQIPYISKWPQALSIQAQPMNIPTSFKQRGMLIDEIWHATGDQSSDMDWYVKRTVLGGIYSTSEVYMLTDHSPEFHDTWSFLDRRIKDAFDLQKTVQEATYLAEAVGAGVGNSLQGFLKKVFKG